MSFSEQLKKARVEAGLTQQQVADAIGITNSTYCGYETGKRQPDVEKIRQIAKLLHTSGDRLLETGFEETEKAPAQEEQELSEVDMRLLALPDDLKQTVLLLVSQAAEVAAPVVQVSELTARRIAAEILKGQESLQQDDTQVAQRR